jgi:hypothetical protein
MYVCMYVRTYVCMYLFMYVCIYISMYVCIYVVYSQHAPLPSVILHALPDHLSSVLLVTYKIYIYYVFFSCSYVM